MNEKHILLIQPPLLKSEMDVDCIQDRYWQELTSRVLNALINLRTEEVAYEYEESYTHYDQNYTGFIEPNIGLLYVAAQLDEAGYQIRYCDFHLMDAELRNEKNRPISVEDVENELRRRVNTDTMLVGISPLTVNHGWAARISSTVKSISEDTVVVLGGVHATFDYERILREDGAVDVVVVGEGEETAVELADALSREGLSHDALAGVKGIAYRGPEGKVCVTGKRQAIADLDTLPYPRYDLLPETYRANSVRRVLTSRGCNNNCSFCVPSAFFAGLRYRDPAKVVDEIEHYYDVHNSRIFMIGDLNFCSDIEHAGRVCRELIDRKLDVLWMGQSRVDMMDNEIAGLMKESGCVMAMLGIESADQGLLDASGKNTSVEQALRACRAVKDAGMLLFTFWVFGLPRETHQSAHRSILLLRKMLDEDLIDYTHCTVCVPYPGTRLYESPGDFGVRIVSQDYDDYWMGCDLYGAGPPVMETEELSSIEIYAYWQLALATVAGNINRRRGLKEPEG
jgi:anaerobic magnesium-protoporphyrin IX monomethyl ester cyclase